VTILGTFELMPKGQKYARRGTVRVIFHKPIPVIGYTVETMAVLMGEVRDAILSLEAGKSPDSGESSIV
jgi:hypothetical protein